MNVERVMCDNLNVPGPPNQILIVNNELTLCTEASALYVGDTRFFMFHRLFYLLIYNHNIRLMPGLVYFCSNKGLQRHNLPYERLILLLMADDSL